MLFFQLVLNIAQASFIWLGFLVLAHHQQPKLESCSVGTRLYDWPSIEKADGVVVLLVLGFHLHMGNWTGLEAPIAQAMT